MPRYCERCCLPFNGERCPACGKKSVRDAAPDDICFLTERSLLWSGMLCDVLKQQKIPFIQKNVMGAGMALRAGPMLESVRFYVFFRHLPAAREIAEGLFAPPDGDGGGESEA